MKVHRQEAQKFYEIDWKNASIKWGTPVIERRMVPTNTPAIEIPSHLRKAALCEALFPEYTLPSRLLSRITLNKLSEVLQLSFESKMLVSRQARLLLNDMDPRERCLPLIPGTDPLLISVKHALVHSNYVICNYKVPAGASSYNWTPSLKLAVEVLIRTAREKRLPLQYVEKAVAKLKIHNSNVLNILNESRLEECLETKWLKALMKQPMTLEHQSGDLIVCPKIETKTYNIMLNKSKIGKRSPTKIELVNFKLDTIRGNFTHIQGNLMNLVCNFTTQREFINMLIEIAYYIGYGWRDTKGTNMRALKQQVAHTITNKTHKFMGISRNGQPGVIS